MLPQIVVQCEKNSDPTTLKILQCEHYIQRKTQGPLYIFFSFLTIRFTQMYSTIWKKRFVSSSSTLRF